MCFTKVISNFRKYQLTCNILLLHCKLLILRFPKSLHLLFYDFSMIYYAFSKFSHLKANNNSKKEKEKHFAKRTQNFSLIN